MTESRTALTWLHDNREWIFSGCGLLVLSLIGSGIRHIWKARRAATALRIALSCGFLTFGPELSEQMLFFTVTNAGSSTAYIAGIKIPLGKHGNMFFHGMQGERAIPCPIAPGTSLKFWTELDGLEAALRGKGISGGHSIRAIVTDGTGDEYRSKKRLALTL
jgi:hypothetical protein